MQESCSKTPEAKDAWTTRRSQHQARASKLHTAKISAATRMIEKCKKSLQLVAQPLPNTIVTVNAVKNCIA